MWRQRKSWGLLIATHQGTLEKSVRKGMCDWQKENSSEHRLNNEEKIVWKKKELEGREHGRLTRRSRRM